MSNWLQEYFTQTSTDRGGVDWSNERSTFEQKISHALTNKHNTHNKKVTRDDLLTALNRADCEEYLSLLITDFLNRKIMFAPSIDVFSVLRRLSSGSSNTSAFSEILGLEKENDTVVLKTYECDNTVPSGQFAFPVREK